MNSICPNNLPNYPRDRSLHPIVARRLNGSRTLIEEIVRARLGRYCESTEWGRKPHR